MTSTFFTLFLCTVKKNMIIAKRGQDITKEKSTIFVLFAVCALVFVFGVLGSSATPVFFLFFLINY